MGFTNYYGVYISDYAKLVANLQEKLKVPREIGKKGSKAPISWNEKDEESFRKIKAQLCSRLGLQRINPDQPFVLRVDASGFAVGAVLEQLEEPKGMPTVEDARDRKTVPIAFLSRKLTEGQRKWVPREQETYAIICALQKWESWIGLQPVLILTDHKALESWATEVLDAPSGPVGRRARWHQFLSRFDLEVGYIPGRENEIPDILSRWAYPASEAFRDISKHGSIFDQKDVKEIMRQEKNLEMQSPLSFSEELPGSKVVGGECPQSLVMPISQDKGDGSSSSASPPRFQFARPRVTPKEGEAQTPPPHGSPVSPGMPNEPLPSHTGPHLSRGLGGTNADQDDSSGDEFEECEGSDSESDGEEESLPSFQQVQMCAWGEEYPNCPVFAKIWSDTQTPDVVWPEGIQISQGRMYHKNKLCVPTRFQKPWIREHHEFLGHVGPDRLWDHMDSRVEFAVVDVAKKYTYRVSKECETCQANQRAHKWAGPIEPTPIPPGIMVHVSIDIFRMDPAEYGDKTFDTMVVCVDRHSGWIVAVPCTNKGLTGRSVALAMLKEWRILGIPSILTSDQGSHFTGEWWRTMCAEMGIRHAYSQAYHHQSNGRVEVAGQQIKEIMRKILADHKKSWVEVLPQVLDRIHDTKGQSGLSPYETLFGRPRPLANLPYRPKKDCEDALQFFDRMRKIDKDVAQTLNNLHQIQAGRFNKDRKKLDPFSPGDEVWYKRPEMSGGPVDSRWLGPAKIISRKGDQSYEVEVKPGYVMDTPRSFLKPCIPDTYNDSPVDLFFHQRTVADPEARPDEFVVEEILNHKIDDKGNWTFLTWWKGYPKSEATWEPPNHFFHRYAADIVKYVRQKKIPLDIFKYLSDKPHGEEVVRREKKKR